MTSAAGALVLVAAFGLAACRHREAPGAPPPAQPTLAGVDVQLSAGEGAPALDTARIETALRDRALASGVFAPAGTPTRLRARIRLEVVEAGPVGEARAQVALALLGRELPDAGPGSTLSPDDLFALQGQGSKRYAIPVGRKKDPGPVDRGPMFEDLVLRIAGDLIDGYAARRQLTRGPPSAVHAALQADGGELRTEAIRAVGERKLHDEAPALLKLLGDPDEPTRDAALGALIALRDRRAVSELTRTRSLRDRHEMHKIIEAIAVLGGQEADDYLSFVAATHDDDEIRAEAATKLR
jgi:hypothetical protein